MIVWQLGNLLSRDHLLVPLPDWLSAEKIQRLNEGLREIFVSLMDLRGADEHSFTAKWSMKEVRELLYDTQDYMDKYEYPPYYFGNYITLSWIGNNVFKMRRPQIAKDFSELMVHFNDVSKRLKSSCLFFFLIIKSSCLGVEEAGVSCFGPQPSGTANINVHLDPGIVVIEEQTNKLVKLLAFDDQKEKQLKVVPIFGFAGVGKATLATGLYRSYKGKFQCGAFLRASRNPDMRRLLASLLSQIKPVLPDDISDLHNLI